MVCGVAFPARPFAVGENNARAAVVALVRDFHRAVIVRVFTPTATRRRNRFSPYPATIKRFGLDGHIHGLVGLDVYGWTGPELHRRIHPAECVSLPCRDVSYTSRSIGLPVSPGCHAPFLPPDPRLPGPLYAVPGPARRPTRPGSDKRASYQAPLRRTGGAGLGNSDGGGGVPAGDDRHDPEHSPDRSEQRRVPHHYGGCLPCSHRRGMVYPFTRGLSN